MQKIYHSHTPIGQQLLWTKQSSSENLDPIVWPRAAASAEIFWTGATLPDGNPRNVTSVFPRLHKFRYRMVQNKFRFYFYEKSENTGRNENI
jgi:hexosaminidase